MSALVFQHVSTQIIRILLSQALFHGLASAPRSGAGLGRLFEILGIGKGRKVGKLGRFSMSNIFIRYAYEFIAVLCSL